MMEGDGVWRPNTSFDKNRIQWPLSYSLTPTPAGGPRREWWDHRYYRGPENQSVQLYYSCSNLESEAIARGFLDEPVLGFDMEWPIDSDTRTRLQEKVAMIQLACENKVALFHIALHDGQTSEELIAPSLRRIIESPHILKTGVAIMNADFKRLKDHFQLQPRGAFELSHLFRLVAYSPHNPEHVTIRMCKLSTQVQQHLGLPLYKGDVRMSDWSLPLDDKQKTYAANDAYASYMLFHCMNAKRLGISPVPPLPKLAESYLPFAWSESPDIPVQLEPVADRPEFEVMTAKLFFSRRPTANEQRAKLRERMEACLEAKLRDKRIKEEVKGGERSMASVSLEPEISQKLLAQLISHRSELAEAQYMAPYFIASNKVLEALARHRPANKRELLKVHGVGQRKAKAYGDDWLQMIARDLAERPKRDSENTTRPSLPTTTSLGAGNRRGDYQKPFDPTSNELYKRLAKHRKALAYAQDWPAFRIAPNTVLEALARERPSNTNELLRIEGIGPVKAAEYGTEWLQIIADFEAEHKPAYSESLISDVPTNSPPRGDSDLLQPEPSDHPSKRRKIRNVGRSKELLLAPPTLSTGLSFQFAETQLHEDETQAENDEGNIYNEPDDSLAFAADMPSPASSELRHKVAGPPESPGRETSTPSLAPNSEPTPAPQPAKEAAQSEPLSLEQQLLRKKLDACVKNVVSLMDPKPTEPIVSYETLDYLVTTVPQTRDEFNQVPHIQGFIQACQGVRKDLWPAFATWTRAAGLARSS
ncbi:hypothetical protein F5Y06DRAFT_262660 [Hypoxylon sp. FL0890]|nr:hypothetical protein F5Y06DRAFT_262660 [Hypoxylon sp. FL0890]